MRSLRPLSKQWRRSPVEPRGPTLLGASFRPLQSDALGLDARETLQTLLAHPFALIRLGAYWNRIEPEPGVFRPDELDWQIEAAERAGKQIILNVGAVKTFGYPEFFAPAHHLRSPLREGALVTPATHERLLVAATAFVTNVVKQYRDRQSIVAWQVEHEAVDPLGMEHSWRLAAAFVQTEVAAVRAADPTRSVMMNGFLPTTWPVRAQQWWRTRDQGDSLSVAQRLADIVGIDYYPRHALGAIGGRTVYLNANPNVRSQRRRRQLFAWARSSGHQLMVAEGQAEPWETVTTPPNPEQWGMYSCLPEQVIENYNQCMRWNQQEAVSLYAYLFWGAEYWVARKKSGDPSYMEAFVRILEES
ncbi:MAG: beta-galactosidase [Chloroflexota bacterium]|nr:beta-galactosidase [Chloroflexota bacterium]